MLGSLSLYVTTFAKNFRRTSSLPTSSLPTSNLLQEFPTYIMSDVLKETPGKKNFFVFACNIFCNNEHKENTRFTSYLSKILVKQSRVFGLFVNLDPIRTPVIYLNLKIYCNSYFGGPGFRPSVTIPVLEREENATQLQKNVV